MPILVCRCGNPAHNTLALMVSCWNLWASIIPYRLVKLADYGRN